MPIKEIGKGLFELRLGEVLVQREAIIAEIDDEVLAKGAAGPADILLSRRVILLDGHRVLVRRNVRS